MKTTRHSLMAKGIMVLLSLLVLIFAFTYTWFSDPESPVTASGLSMSVRNTSTDFEYAIGFSNSQTGGEYKHTQFTNEVSQNLNLEALLPFDESDTSKTVNLLYDYNPIDITGNGVTLVRPAMNYGNWDINTASSNYSVAEENIQFISFDMIFRTHVANTTIKLDRDSYAKGNCENYSGDGRLIGASSESSGADLNYNELTSSGVTSNKYGRFSRDAIVGAVRVAFLDYEPNDGVDVPVSALVSKDLVKEGYAHYAEVPALLWIPRPDLFLNNNASGISDSSADKKTDPLSWRLDTNVTDVDKLLVSKAQTTSTYRTYKHQYYNVFQVADSGVAPSLATYEDAVASVLNTQAGADTNKVVFGNTEDLLNLNYYEDTNNNNEVDASDYYYGKIRVRIWIEGTDSESRRALAGGKFNVSFHITG